MMRRIFSAIVMAGVFAIAAQPRAESGAFNSFGQKLYTIESPHFSIHYQDSLESTAREIGTYCEGLYDIYRNTYNITLPNKTTVLVSDADPGNGFALALLNTININANGDFFVLRGTHDWLKDVVTHEFAHQISIASSFKFPAWMPYIQLGYFNHPNIPARVEALHIFPSDVLPSWFVEGIAQFESSRRGADTWDSHRDMYLRTYTLSDKLLTWDHMQLFSGRGDDFERTYNHGFSMVTYIAQTYGYDKVVSMLRESAVLTQLDFDGVIKAVLGISGRQLYADWKQHLTTRYKSQLTGLGSQVFGRKVSTEGYYNYAPRFSSDNSRIYYISNSKNDYYLRSLYSAAVADTVPAKKRVRIEMPKIKENFCLSDSGRYIAFASQHSDKSTMPSYTGGQQSKDIFIDTLPSDSTKKKFKGFFPKKTERQVTTKRNAMCAAFSPKGNMLAIATRHYDHFFLEICDTNIASKPQRVYPVTDKSSDAITYINSIDWSADGHSIAISYLDKNGDGTIGIYDTLDRSFTLSCNTKSDERDPRFSKDGSQLYFSSDRTGIFNIYRLTRATGQLDRITNVSGGAFTPDPSNDNRKLSYVNFDKDGLGIYVLDSIRVLDSAMVDTARLQRIAAPIDTALPHAIFSQPRPYSHLPRQLLVIPTGYVEETVTDAASAYSAQGVFKAGAIFAITDPFAWIDQGTELNAYALIEPDKIFQFFNPDELGINSKRNYEFGFSGTTRLLPLTLSLDFSMRGIAGSDKFYDEYIDTMLTMRYNLSPKSTNLTASHTIKGVTLTGWANYNWYHIYISTESGDFPYTAAQGAKAGLYATMIDREPDSRSSISPKGLALKASYDLSYQNLVNEKEAIKIENSLPVENYDIFVMHEVTGRARFGTSSPWYDKHDLYCELDGTVLRLTDFSRDRLVASGKSDKLPQFYQPAVWLPGYTYYDSDGKYDTLLLTGEATVQAAASYRFPLWPRSIDTKIGFIYLEYLYGAINGSAGGAFAKPGDLLLGNRNNWLVSAGAELRLQAISFNTFPVAVSLRWDRGFDRPAPAGGDRFTLRVGFNFDNWELITLPGYSHGLVGL